MRRVLITLSLILAVACAKQEAPQATNTTPTDTTTTTAAPPLTQEPIGMRVTFGDGGVGYLSSPKTPGKHAAIIVIQEWWGVDDWIHEQTDRFAKDNYVALAVDLYRGRSTKDPDEAHELMRGLPQDRALADLKAGFEYLAQRQDVDPHHIGVIGWCMGGGYSLALETHEPRLAACVVNYGSLVTDPDAITKIKAPILGNFGANDRGIPPDDVKAFGAALTKYGKLGDVKVYDGAGHAFMNPNNKEGYNATAAQDAWTRIDGFFARNLRDKIGNS